MFVSLKQLKRAREEIEEKYKAENKLYVDKAAFDSEYSILQELCEKTFTMVSDVVSNLFPNGLVFEPFDHDEKREYYMRTYNLCQESFILAHKAINKYACFLPEKWYNKFVELKKQCAIQLKCFFFCKISCASNANLDTTQCCNRTGAIEKDTEVLISELRQYISSLTHKEETNNGD